MKLHSIAFLFCCCCCLLLPFCIMEDLRALFDLWRPHLKGIVVLWISSPTGQQLHNEITTRPISLSELKLPSWRSSQLYIPMSQSTQASACKLLTPRISKDRPFLRWGRQLGGAQAHGSHFPAHAIFFHWLKQQPQLLFGEPCLLTMTQTVSEL